MQTDGLIPHQNMLFNTLFIDIKIISLCFFKVSEANIRTKIKLMTNSYGRLNLPVIPLWCGPRWAQKRSNVPSGAAEEHQWYPHDYHL